MDQPWMYIVLLGLVLVVYAKIIPKAPGGAARDSGGMVGEMEEAMDHFAAELEEQNQALIAMFAETKKENEMQYVRLASRVEALEKQNAALQQELSRVSFAQEQHKEEHRGGVSFAAAPPPQVPASAPPAGGQMILPQDPASALHPLELQALQPDGGEAAPEPPPAPKNIKDRYEELFRLYEQGKSTDAIAKKLGLNKGEIHLILQLAKQEEKTHA
ncbi:hypothetical protein ERY13_25585 [Paenibacillus mucilaginosus]|nr:hypothetical protein [Paenibacillus mucilaginosus]WFA20365.1 hypothetical protein ERY13_25585 [Paenibacillus mucilaginosus]